MADEGATAMNGAIVVDNGSGSGRQDWRFRFCSFLRRFFGGSWEALGKVPGEVSGRLLESSWEAPGLHAGVSPAGTGGLTRI